MCHLVTSVFLNTILQILTTFVIITKYVSNYKSTTYKTLNVFLYYFQLATWHSVCYYIGTKGIQDGTQRAASPKHCITKAVVTALVWGATKTT